MPIDNPQLCCLMGVCCSPAQQRTALAAQIKAWRTPVEVDKGGDLDAYLADMLLATFDLAPKGVGQAIVAGYRAAFCAELPPYPGPVDPETPIELT